MKVTDGGDVPGITGGAACAEAERVVEKMADDNFDDFLGKPVGRGWACGSGLRGYSSRADPPDFGFGSIPKSHGEQFDDWEYYGGFSCLSIPWKEGLGLPGSEDVGVFVGDIAGSF